MFPKEMAMIRNDQESAGSGMFILGAVAGALVGAGVALLMAPKSGAETRQDLNSGLNTARDVAARRYRDLADRANEKIGQLEKKVEQYSARAASTVNDAASKVHDAASNIPHV
jgi:gas vesicle protein